MYLVYPRYRNLNLLRTWYILGYLGMYFVYLSLFHTKDFFYNKILFLTKENLLFNKGY